ncbi:MAG: magnesium transporter, partial [Planctomycetota bacterium]
MANLTLEIQKLIDQDKQDELAQLFDELSLEQKVRLVSRLRAENQVELVRQLHPETSAEILHSIPDVQTIEIVAELDAPDAVTILQELPSDEQADIINDLDEGDAEAILQEFPPRQSAGLRQLACYENNVAGGLMTNEFLAFNSKQTVESVIRMMRQKSETFSDFQVQYAYVVDSQNALIGVLRLRDLLLSEGNPEIGEIMIGSPNSINDTAGMLELRQFFDDHSYVGVPVTNSNGTLVGVVDESDVEEAWSKYNASNYLKSQGIIQEELRTMPLALRSRRRLAWLSINIVLNFFAASVIAVYEETLSQVIALAVFLPIISDMSGCSGNQAVAVSMRELALGVLRPTEILFVLFKEASVGLVNGMALGTLIAAAAFLWQGNPWLGLVVGTALMINTLIAVILGGTLPLIMRSLNLDPALASGPILT